MQFAVTFFPPFLQATPLFLVPRISSSVLLPCISSCVSFPSEEQFILSQAALLEQVSNLQPFLDSTHIKGNAPSPTAALWLQAASSNVRFLMPLCRKGYGNGVCLILKGSH